MTVRVDSSIWVTLKDNGNFFKHPMVDVSTLTRTRPDFRRHLKPFPGQPPKSIFGPSAKVHGLIILPIQFNYEVWSDDQGRFIPIHRIIEVECLVTELEGFDLVWNRNSISGGACKPLQEYDEYQRSGARIKLMDSPIRRLRPPARRIDHYNLAASIEAGPGDGMPDPTGEDWQAPPQDLRPGELSAQNLEETIPHHEIPQRMRDAGCWNPDLPPGGVLVMQHVLLSDKHCARTLSQRPPDKPPLPKQDIRIPLRASDRQPPRPIGRIKAEHKGICEKTFRELIALDRVERVDPNVMDIKCVSPFIFIIERKKDGSTKARPIFVGDWLSSMARAHCVADNSMPDMNPRMAEMAAADCLPIVLDIPNGYMQKGVTEEAKTYLVFQSPFPDIPDLAGLWCLTRSPQGFWDTGPEFHRDIGMALSSALPVHSGDLGNFADDVHSWMRDPVGTTLPDDAAHFLTLLREARQRAPETFVSPDPFFNGDEGLQRMAVILQHAYRVLKALGKTDLPCKLSKLKIGYRKLEVYGRMVDCVSHTHSLTPAYLDGIANLEEPHTLAGLYSFVGYIPWGDKDTPEIYPAAAPLYNVLSAASKQRATVGASKVNVRRLMAETPGAKQAVQDVKRLLMSSIARHAIDPSRWIYLVCDASRRGMCGAIVQYDPDTGRPAIVAYISSIWKGTMRYITDAYLLELIGFVIMLRKAMPLLRPFMDRVCALFDHMNMVWSRKDLPAWVWSYYLQFCLLIKNYAHMPGKSNPADMGSRGTQDDSEEVPEWEGIGRLMEKIKRACPPGPQFIPSVDPATPVPPVQPPRLPEAARGVTAAVVPREVQYFSSQQLTPFLQRVSDAQQVAPSDERATWEKGGEFSATIFPTGTLIRRGKAVVIPSNDRNLQQWLIKRAHLPAHDGVAATTRALQRLPVWWPEMEKDIRQYVEVDCLGCREQHQRDGPDHVGHHVGSPCPQRPYSVIHVDFFSAGNHNYIGAACAMTSHATVAHVSNKTAATAVSFLEVLVWHHSPPDVIYVDKDSAFDCAEVRKFCEYIGSKLVVASKGDHRAITFIEMFWKRLARASRASDGRSAEELLHLHYLELVYYINARPSDRLGGKSPHEVVYGYPPMTTLNSSTGLAARYNRTWEQFLSEHDELIRFSAACKELSSLLNKDTMDARKTMEFTPGQKVLMWLEPQGKLQRAYDGPYTVHARDGEVYRIEHDFHRDFKNAPVHFLRPYYGSVGVFDIAERDLRAGEDFVDAILGHEEREGRLFFTVRWHGGVVSEHTPYVLSNVTVFRRYVADHGLQACVQRELAADSANARRAANAAPTAEAPVPQAAGPALPPVATRAQRPATRGQQAAQVARAPKLGKGPNQQGAEGRRTRQPAAERLPAAPVPAIAPPVQPAPTVHATTWRFKVGDQVTYGSGQSSAWIVDSLFTSEDGQLGYKLTEGPPGKKNPTWVAYKKEHEVSSWIQPRRRLV